MIKIDVIVKDKNWLKFIKNPDKYLKRKIKKIQKNKFFGKNKYNFSIQLSGSKEIKLLNKKFRKKNNSTDILSFPNQTKKELKKLIITNKKIYLGDIIINHEKMNANSKIVFRNHFDILLIHGLVHLFGYKHKSDYNYRKMFSIEKNLLKNLHD